jgi:hypothetical protein
MLNRKKVFKSWAAFCRRWSELALVPRGGLAGWAGLGGLSGLGE